MLLLAENAKDHFTKLFLCKQNERKKMCRVFPRSFTHGGICPPPYGGGASAGGQNVNGGVMRGDIDLIGDLTLIDYIIN